MPQFTPWNVVPSPFPNVLFNPAAVEEAVARSQSELGTLDINRQRLGLEREKLAQDKAAGAAWLGGGDGTGTPGAYPPSGGGGGGDSTTETADDLTRAAAVRDGLIKRGMQLDGATAFAANALHESKANPATGAGDAGASHGIFQWNGDRLAAFRAANGGLLPEQTSLDKQLDFVVSELHGSESTALGRIMGAQGVGDKAGQVSEAYLRPKDTGPEMQRRAATALRLARAWGGQGVPGATPGALPVPPRLLGGDPRAPVQIPPPLASPPAAPPGASPLPPPEAPLAPMAGAQVAGPGAPTSGRIPPSPPGSDAAVADIRAGMVGAGADPATLAPGARMTPVPVAAPDQAEPETGLPLANTLPAVPIPNQIYKMGAPGLGGRTATLAPPAAPGTQPTAPGATAPPGAAAAPTRPPVLQPPPAPSRTVPMEQLIQSGPGKDLTPAQFKMAGAMIAGGTPIANVMAHVEQWREANLTGLRQTQTLAAQQQQQDYDRQRQFRQDQIEAEKTDYQRKQDAETARRNAAADARAEVTAKNAGLPPGYRMDDSGHAYRIDGLPPDPAIAEAAKAAFDAEQRKQPFQGVGTNEQNRNMLIAGTKSGQIDTPEYASAYADLAAPKYNADGSFVKPNMAAYAKPTWKPPGATEVPDYGSQETPVPTILTMEQGRVAGFADRARQALPVISDTSEAAMNRWQIMLGKAPLVGNALITPEFQLHQQAERNFINAVLRRESGAAIASDEFVQARQQYIPQPGDSPQVLAQKAQNRETVLAGMTREAGPGYKPAQPPTSPTSPTSPATVKSDADFNSLPSGALFVGPDGKTRRKP